MNVSDILVLLILGLLVFSAFRTLRGKRKNGCAGTCSCCGSSKSCPASSTPKSPDKPGS